MSKPSLRVLHVAPSYYPATQFGGPIWSTYALCNALAAQDGVELRVLTTDTAGYQPFRRLSVSSFPVVYPPGYNVYFTRCIMGCDVAPGLLARLGRMVGWADVVVLTGTYSFPTIPMLLACRLFDKPLVWSPRGALEASHEWREARRPVLKRAWEIVCRSIKPRHCVLHVTSEVEKAASRARLPEFDAAIIPNGVDLPKALPSRFWRPDGTLRLAFMGRLDPIKGLENLLHTMAMLDPHTMLKVYGAGEQGYVRSLQQLAAQLGIANRVRFRGHVEGDAKRDAFLGADVLVLPSHSENFGMVVAEALAHGVPAVVSHGAPWSELEARGCGRWVANSPKALAQAIESLRAADLAAMGARGRAWMQADFSWEERAQEMRALFQQLMAKRSSLQTRNSLPDHDCRIS